MGDSGNSAIYLTHDREVSEDSYQGESVWGFYSDVNGVNDAIPTTEFQRENCCRRANRSDFFLLSLRRIQTEMSFWQLDMDISSLERG